MFLSVKYDIIWVSLGLLGIVSIRCMQTKRQGVYVCIWVNVCVCMHMCVCVCACMRMCVCVCV